MLPWLDEGELAGERLLLFPLPINVGGSVELVARPPDSTAGKVR